MSWLNLFFGFSGRIRRLEFHLAALVPMVLYMPAMADAYRSLKLVALAASSGALSASDMLAQQQPEGSALSAALSIVGVYIMLTLNAKRLHDLGKSGWWQGIAFLGLPVALAGFVMIFIPQVQALGFMLCLGSMVFSVWGLWIMIQVWFFPGQAGSNPYGPNPASGAIAASLEHEIMALQAAAPDLQHAEKPAAGAEPRRAQRTPSVTVAKPSGFGRRTPRIA